MIVLNRENEQFEKIDVTNKDNYKGYVKFNVVSDLHMDFYFDYKNPYNYIREFKENIEDKCDYLIVAGDIANHNQLAWYFLESMNYFYKKVFVIDGNHEYYSNWVTKDKYTQLKELCKDFDNIIFLDDHDIIEVEGIKIAGRMMMYDLTRLKDYQFYQTISNDSKYIPEYMVRERHIEHCEAYNRFIDECDIFISHIPLILQENNDYIPSNHRDISLYYNSSVDLKPNKLYINGHVHQRQANVVPIQEGVCYNLNTATGYPGENDLGLQMSYVETLYIDKTKI